MCGLVAIFNYSEKTDLVDRNELIAIRDYMHLRGPDAAGEWFSGDGRVGLGHRRLSIFDLSDAGHQPMSYQQGRYFVVFNGAIYNFLTLKQELQKKGYTFYTNTDTEVLLAGWLEWNHDLVQHIEGMFAFVIYDSVSGTLFATRDPFGIKPLYYSDDGTTVRFASQVKALVSGAPDRYEKDLVAEVGYMMWGSIQEPDTTHKQIKALEPGTYWLIKNGVKRVGRYSSVTDMVVGSYANKSIVDSESLRERYKEAISRSIRQQLVADVPVGIFLSSGLDSNCLAALGMESSSQNIFALTLGFKEFLGTELDETILATKSAASIGCDHEVKWIDRALFEAHQMDFFHSMDQPSIDGLNTWFVCKAAKDAGLKVAISGLGADEFLSGYPSFKHVPVINRMAVMQARFGLTKTPILRLLMERLFTNSTKVDRLLSIGRYGSDIKGSYFLKRAIQTPSSLKKNIDPEVMKFALGYFESIIMTQTRLAIPDDLKISGKLKVLEGSLYMRNQLLRDSDWASMAHGIELACRFLIQLL